MCSGGSVAHSDRALLTNKQKKKQRRRGVKRKEEEPRLVCEKGTLNWGKARRATAKIHTAR